MEFIIELAAVIICIYLLYLAIRWLIVNVIAPVGKWVVIGFAVAGVVVGFFTAIFSYIKAIKRYINPYDYYVDHSNHKQQFAKRRSYFFGPGFNQLKTIISGAWSGISRTISKVNSIRYDIAHWADSILLVIVMWILSALFFVLSIVTVGIVGSIITVVITVILSVILVVFMAITYVLFSITWIVDRIYLAIKAINTSCPYCQKREVIPAFECPSCKEKHTRLVPGPYGIWFRRCKCGKLLPTTFMLGRSSLKAYCNTCNSPLASSDSQQLSVSLVGGTSSGKTVLLASFLHEFMQQIDKKTAVEYVLPDDSDNQTKFSNIKTWFSGGKCESTSMGTTADMYTMLIKSHKMDVGRQFSVYDIAGEAFNDPTLASMLPQKQMKDSNGIVLVIDPLSAAQMRDDAKEAGDDTKNYSEVNSVEVIANFVSYLKTVLTSSKIKKKSGKPVAVVITKSDLASVSKRISYYVIKKKYKADPGLYENFDSARDTLCRQFLQDIGLWDAVNSIEASFSNVHYYPVSAIGHAANGEEYEPDHVLEPFAWLIGNSSSAIAELIGLSDC